MIVVVEGISASGKSTWCAEHGNGHIIAENGPFRAVPDQLSDPLGAASFWAARNADRWQAALALESATSVAVCDTDPLKLHYAWCLWRIGETTERDWLLALAATRATVARKRIGFADSYLVGEIDPHIARERARMDTSRRRRHFELHVRLQPALIDWYSALDAVLPGRVQFGFPATLPTPTRTGVRYDVSVFDRMIEDLSRRSGRSV